MTIRPATLPRRGHAGRRLLLLLVSMGALSCGQASQPDVVLITIDTLRADRLGCYGHADARTPVLDRFAQEGVRFEFCDSPVPITLPAHASLLTGELPARHGVRNNLIYALPNSVPTLAERFAENGYQTGAFVSAFPVDARFGLDRGFDHYDDEFDEATDSFEFKERSGLSTVREALDWLRRRDEDRPLFLWVHLFEPHSPYLPPAPYDRMDDPYDGEVATADMIVGQLLSGIERERKRARVIAITSDHGEGLGEHGEDSHSFFLYESTLRVPLLIQAPRFRPGQVVHEPVSLCDVAPTLLELSGCEPDLGHDGIALQPGRIPTRQLIAESLYGMEAFGWSPMFSLREGPQKVIRSARSRAFDLDADPGEIEDLFAGSRDWPDAQLDRLDTRIRALAVEVAEDAERSPSAEEVEALASLGYAGGLPLGGSGDPASTLLASMAQLPDGTERLDELSKLEQAQDLLRESRTEAAIALLEQVVADNTGNGWAQSLLAGALKEHGDPQAALRAFEESAARQPLRASHQLELGRLKWQLGRSDEAIAHLERALQLEPRNLRMLREVNEFFITTGQAARAVAQLNAHLIDAEALPRAEQLELHTLMAETCLQTGQLQKGNAHLQAARQIEDAASLKILSARYLRAEERWTDMVGLLAPPDARLQSNATAHFLLGLAQDRLGQVDSAVAAYRRALSLDDSLDMAHARLAWLLASHLGRAEEALTPARRAVELRPQQPDYHYVYVDVLKRLGRDDEAKAHLQHILPQHPHFVPLAQQAARFGME